MTFKFLPSWKKLGHSLFLCVSGIVLLYVPTHPGTFSNIVAWLETDGHALSLLLGTCFLILGGLFLFFSLRPSQSFFRIVHGKLTCAIALGIMKQVVEQIFREFFEIDFSAEVFLLDNILHIKVKTPSNFSQTEEFLEHLRNRLFHLTGYYGDIRILKSF